MQNALRPAFAAIMLSTAMLAGCASGTSQQAAAPQPAKPIDVARFFTGRWYEIGRTPMKMTDGCVAGTTDYFRQTDGQLMDRDACRMGTPDGKEKVYQGPVTILDTSANNKVTVKYIVAGVVPLSRTYWMLDHGDDYAWFIVSDPEFQNVSIFTRAARPAPAEVDRLKARVRSLGYDPTKLEFPAQFSS